MHRVDGGPGQIYRGKEARRRARVTAALLTGLLVLLVGSLALLALLAWAILNP